MRLLHAFIFALATLIASPVYSQVNFEGLDFDSQKKKKKKKKRKKRKRKTRRKTRRKSLRKATTLPKKTKQPERVEQSTAQPGAVITFEPVDVLGKTGDRQRMDMAIIQYRDEEYETAALAFFEIKQDLATTIALRAESAYWLAKSLYKLGMYHSALQMFSQVLAHGNRTKFFKNSLEWLFFIARRTINETVVLDEIAKYSGYEFPKRFRSEFHYLLSRYNIQRGKALDDAGRPKDADKSFHEAKRLISKIPKGNPFYSRAQYLKGLVYFRENKLEMALESMKEVVRTTRRKKKGPMTAAEKNQHALRELAFMQLARTHYGARQNRNAIFYLSKIQRGGSQWLESLFESSWAHYRIGQYEQALGDLITLSSPFFRDEAIPEAMILKAVIYFENCRYPEVIDIIKSFEAIYGPVQEALNALTSKDMEAVAYFNVLDDVLSKRHQDKQLSETEEILGRILNLALTDKDLKKTIDSIHELVLEIDSLSLRGDEFKYSSLSQSLIDALKVQREALIEKAGLLAKGKLHFELENLRRLRVNGLRIKFETSSQEKKFLEQMLAAGGEIAIVKKYRYSVAVPDEYLYWPYMGEYWRDELGTYQYTLTKGCIDRKFRAQKPN